VLNPLLGLEHFTRGQSPGEVGGYEPGRTNMAIERIDGTTFRKLLMGGVRWVSFHRDILNDLNVYPVPDGDTGTNMYMTLRGAVSSFRLATDSSMGSLLKAISRGALFGARGNSGVILSQLFTGFAKHFKGKEELTIEDLAPAFEQAREKMYQAVNEPKEGTILTVVSDIARAFACAHFPCSDLLEALEFMHETADTSLVASRDLLEVLKENDVVDAGGKGLVYLLEGMLRAARYEDFRRRELELPPTGLAPRKELESLELPYCVEFIIDAPAYSDREARQVLEGMGNSLVLALSGTILKLHIHTDDPEKVRRFCLSMGEVLREKVDNMQQQHRSLLRGEYPLVLGEKQHSSFTELTTALAAIVAGNGLIDVFGAAGAFVIDGGQTMNPSVEDIVTLLGQIPAQAVILLPNNPNCLIVCEQAARIVEKKVRVVPTRDLMQGLAFLNHYDPSMALEELLARFSREQERYLTMELCRATKSAHLDGRTIGEGDWIALASGKVKACGPSLEEVLSMLAVDQDVLKRTMVTLVAGDTEIAGAGDMVELVRQSLPMEVNYIYGGQPHYPLLLGFFQLPVQNQRMATAEIPA
jgi:uncharacterized protein